MPDRPLILVVEDDYNVRTLIGAYIQELGYRLVLVNELSAAVAFLSATSPHLIIADVKLPDGNGNELAKLANSNGIPLLLISGDPHAIEQHDGAGAVPFLGKPFRLAELEQKIAELLRKSA